MSYEPMGIPVYAMKMDKKYVINKLYKKGNIRFYTPEKWVCREIEAGLGQGDRFEGTFAIDYDTNREVYYRKKYGRDLVVNRYNDIKYYQLKSTLKTPTYCFYSLMDSHLNHKAEILNNGIYEFDSQVTKDFFKDFSAASVSSELLSDDERPALLIIVGSRNIMEFVRRIKAALKMEYKLNDNNIIVDQVKYDYSRNNTIDYYCDRKHPPLELFCKNDFLSYQRETRIIINSHKHKLERGEYLEINVGSLEDISVMKNIISLEDQKLKFTATVTTLQEKYDRDGYIQQGYDYFDIDGSLKKDKL